MKNNNKKNSNQSINSNRRKLLGLAGAAIPAALLSPLLSKAAPSTIIEAGSNVDTASYIIFQDSEKVYAKNGMTGKIEFHGSDASGVIQSVINALSTTGGKIFIKAGTYILSTKATHTIASLGIIYNDCLQIISLNNIKIIGEGKGATILKLADGSWTNLTNPACIIWAYNYINFELGNLTLDGNKANQTGHIYQDGAGNILTGGLRGGAYIHDFESKNSGGNPIYLGYNSGGYENKACVFNLYTHDNDQPFMLDNVTNSNVSNIISENDGTATATKIGFEIYGANNYTSRDDKLQLNNITVLGGRLYTYHANGVSINNLVVDRNDVYSSIEANTTGLLTLNNINIRNSNSSSSSFGILAHDSIIQANIGYVSSFVSLYASNNGSIYASNLKLFGNSSTMKSFLNSKLVALNCYLVPTVGQYMFNVDGTSRLTLIGCQSETLENKYIHPTAILTASKNTNMGNLTECSVLSDIFAIDSTDIKTITIAHGLAITPAVQNCYLTIVTPTTTDFSATVWIDSVNSLSVIAKVNVSTASATNGATAKLALRVENA